MIYQIKFKSGETIKVDLPDEWFDELNRGYARVNNRIYFTNDEEIVYILPVESIQP